MTRLTGKELLDKIKEFQNLSLKECASACGYTTENGRVDEKGYLLAIAQANGLHTGAKTARKVRLSNKISVHANGGTVVGKVFLEAIGLTPGDEISVVVKGNKVILGKVEEENEPKLRVA